MFFWFTLVLSVVSGWGDVRCLCFVGGGSGGCLGVLVGVMLFVLPLGGEGRLVVDVLGGVVSCIVELY